MHLTKSIYCSVYCNGTPSNQRKYTVVVNHKPKPSNGMEKGIRKKILSLAFGVFFFRYLLKIFSDVSIFAFGFMFFFCFNVSFISAWLLFGLIFLSFDQNFLSFDQNFLSFGRTFSLLVGFSLYLSFYRFFLLLNFYSKFNGTGGRSMYV